VNLQKSLPAEQVFGRRVLSNKYIATSKSKFIINKFSKMKQTIFIVLILTMITSCQTDYQPSENTLYESDRFSVLRDKVVQGGAEAVALSPTQITSNYKSPASQTYRRLIEFKFSLNEKDNELPVGVNRRLVIEGEGQSPVYTFGQTEDRKMPDPGTYLSPNTRYTFRVDLSPVIQQFEEKGFYSAYDGSTIARSEFKGIYIAGGSEPMTWDFVNLENRGLQMKDPDGDNIYEITLILNPFNESMNADKEWTLQNTIDGYPQFSSDIPLVDALYNLSLDETKMLKVSDGTFRTGAKWEGVWTRDVSYSILLAYALIEPEVAKTSLRRKVKRNRIIQDTGSGGAWPVSSDRTTWALAAWEIFKTTGDQAWLEEAFEIIKNSVADDQKTLASTTGMYKGESSFLDWREQTYPKWMDNRDIYVSENLGTNAVHFQTYQILAEMADLLGQPSEEYRSIAQQISNGINEFMWMNNEGFYGQFIYGRHYQHLSPRFEALGEAFTVLFDIASDRQKKAIMENAPLTPFGVTCIYPQIPGIPPYHNNGIWPFVQAFWNIAAAKAGNEKVLDHGLGSIYRAAGLFLTNYENFVAETGDFLGTEINSERQLWSVAGNLAMVYKVFLGMDFQADGIQFAPVIPAAYAGQKTLKQLKYRNAVLDISVNGYGNRIRSITLDGEELEEAFLPADVEGAHSIQIEMANNSFSGDDINLVDNKFSLPNPQVTLSGDQLEWNPIEGVDDYFVYKNGQKLKSVDDTAIKIKTTSEYSEYAVSAFDKEGFESFISEPILVVEPGAEQIEEAEKYASPAGLPFVNYSGRGFVSLTKVGNRQVNLDVRVRDRGEYLIDVRYSNGSGPWNTDNKCAIRSLYVNGEYQGPIVMPQRGQNEWSDWSFSNSLLVNLNRGKNEISIRFEPWNENMNVGVNRAMLDYIRLIKK
jgi:hypothetical protein